jgi:hypothetical protein
MIKIIFTILFFAGMSNLVNAATWTNGEQLVSATIWRPGYHGFYVTAANFHDPQGCRTSSAESLYLFDPAFEAAEQKTVDRLYSMILTAQTSGKKLHVFVDGCVNQYPRITGLQVNN